MPCIFPHLPFPCPDTKTHALCRRPVHFTGLFKLPTCFEVGQSTYRREAEVGLMECRVQTRATAAARTHSATPQPGSCLLTVIGAIAWQHRATSHWHTDIASFLQLAPRFSHKNRYFLCKNFNCCATRRSADVLESLPCRKSVLICGVSLVGTVLKGAPERPTICCGSRRGFTAQVNMNSRTSQLSRAQTAIQCRLWPKRDIKSKLPIKPLIRRRRVKRRDTLKCVINRYHSSLIFWKVKWKKLGSIEKCVNKIGAHRKMG